MGVETCGYVIVDGNHIDVGSAEFNKLFPITAGLTADVEADDNIASVTTALAMAVFKLEAETRNLRDQITAIPRSNTETTLDND